MFTLSSWITKMSKLSQERRVKSIRIRNRYLTGLLATLVMLAISILVSFGVKESSLPYPKLVMKTVDEIIFLVMALFIYLFVETYMTCTFSLTPSPSCSPCPYFQMRTFLSLAMFEASVGLLAPLLR